MSEAEGVSSHDEGDGQGITGVYEDYADVDADDDIETPLEPPIKPPALVQFYVEQNRHSLHRSNPHWTPNEINNKLRTQFREELGKSDKQRVKSTHKKSMAVYSRKLELYQHAHPEFNAEEYYAEAEKKSAASGSRKRSGGGGGGSRKRKKRDRDADRDEPVFAAGRGRPKNDTYELNTFESDDEEEAYTPTAKRQRVDDRDFGPSATSTKEEESGHSTFDQIMKDIRSAKSGGRSKRGHDIDINNAQGGAMKIFVEKMRDAARNDWISNTQKQPTIEMMKMVDTVSIELSKKKLHDYFIEECMVLDAVRDWIHPLPDASLPLLKVRSEMYRIIQKMELHGREGLSEYFGKNKDKTEEENAEEEANEDSLLRHFRKKSFSETVMTLWAHPNETPENKAMLRPILTKWIRQLSNANLSYDVYRDELGERRQEIINRNETLQKQKKSYNLGPRKRAQIPEKAWFDFAEQPQPKLDDDDKQRAAIMVKPAHRAIDQKFKTLRKKADNNSLVRPSISGRRK